MQPADDPNIDYKKLVQRGYDRCAAAYDQARRGDSAAELDLLTGHLTPGAHVLDIGCGAGVPIARALVAQGFRVTGVDISAEQIRRAQKNVPGGYFVQADILSVDFPAASFDAAAAFYSIFHLPREEHADLFRRVHRWLRPGGLLLATVSSAREDAYTEDDFFGVTMYWNSHGIEEYKVILIDEGFDLLHVGIVGHGYGDESDALQEHHPLILARAGH